MSGYIFNNKGIRAGVLNGTSIFDLGGKKVYDLKGNNIYRLSGELVGHTLNAPGSDKRLDRDSEGLLSVEGQPEPDEPEKRPVPPRQPTRQPTDNFAEAIRLRRIISDTPFVRPKRG